MSLLVINKFPVISSPGYSYEAWNRQFINHNVILNGKYSYIYYPSHWTPLSLKFAFGGTEYYMLDNIRYGVDDNKFLILNQGTIYKSLIDSEKPVNSFTLNFKEDFVQDVYNTIINSEEMLLDYPEIKNRHPVNFFQKLYDKDDVITPLAFEIKKLISLPQTDYSLINEKMHFILEHAFKLQFKTSKDADSIKSKKRSTRYELFNRLNYAKDYIRSNYKENIDLNELSRISCLSAHHLLRQFKLNFGVTPHKFLTRVRLNEAKELIINSQKSITEICDAVGFESLSSFGMLFKKHFSLSPENYRKRFSKKSIFRQYKSYI